MTYEFQSTLFRTASAMCDAIASEWLTAGGGNTAADVANVLATTTDEALAAEVIEGWNLSEEIGHDETWMEARGIDADDIEAAFARIRDGGSDLVLVRSDEGDGGWSLHAAGATDEEIAEGDAPALMTGTAGRDDAGEWDAPRPHHYAAAALCE
jgi:hypothetical protein